MAMYPSDVVISGSLPADSASRPIRSAEVKVTIAGKGTGALDYIMYLQGVTFNVSRQMHRVIELGSESIYFVPVRTIGTLQAQRAIGPVSFVSKVGAWFESIEITGLGSGGLQPKLFYGRVQAGSLSINNGQAVMMEQIQFIGDVANWSGA